MILSLNGEEIGCDAVNSAFMVYDNEMARGLLVDVDDTQCLFVPHWVEGYDNIYHLGTSEGIPELPIEGEVDWEAEPHRWVANSLAQLLVAKVCE